MGKILRMPSWVISIAPVGTHSLFLGSPSSCPSSSTGKGSPRRQSFKVPAASICLLCWVLPWELHPLWVDTE